VQNKHRRQLRKQIYVVTIYVVQQRTAILVWLIALALKAFVMRTASAGQKSVEMNYALLKRGQERIVVRIAVVTMGKYATK